MANVNIVALLGRLTRDPELRYSQGGTAVCQMSMAMNRKWKSGEEMREEVCFVEITAFGKTAEAVANHLKKGSECFVEGRLHLDQWDDKTTGQKRSKLGVIANGVQFIGGKKDDGAAEPTIIPEPATASEEAF